MKVCETSNNRTRLQAPEFFKTQRFFLNSNGKNRYSSQPCSFDLKDSPLSLEVRVCGRVPAIEYQCGVSLTTAVSMCCAVCHIHPPGISWSRGSGFPLSRAALGGPTDRPLGFWGRGTKKLSPSITWASILSFISIRLLPVL